MLLGERGGGEGVVVMPEVGRGGKKCCPRMTEEAGVWKVIPEGRDEKAGGLFAASIARGEGRGVNIPD